MRVVGRSSLRIAVLPASLAALFHKKRMQLQKLKAKLMDSECTELGLRVQAYVWI